MSEKKNISSLSDVMGKEPRSTGHVAIDLTKPMDSIPTNEAEGAETEVRDVQMKAETVQTGHIDSEDFGKMKSVDSTDILPNKAPEPSSMENDLFGALDKAVDRECESITKRVDELTETQKEEFKKEAKAAEDAQQKEEDEFALGVSSEFDEELPDDMKDDELDAEEASVTTAAPAKRVTIDVTSTEEDATKLYVEESVSAVDTNKSDENDISVASPIDVKDNAEVVEEPKKVTIKKATEGSSTTDDKQVSILDGVADKDLFDDEEDETAAANETDSDEVFDKLKAEVKAKITPIRKNLDLSKFTIAKKSANASKVMKLAVQNHQCIADWALYEAERPISLTGLSGPEILKLNPDNSTRNRLNTFRDMYRVIYDHIYDGNKPEFEAWLKQTRFVDVPHIHFGLYMATFQGSNFLTYSCDKCNKVFIKDVDFKDMVEYANDEAKEKVHAILKKDTTSPSNDEYEVDLVQVSDTYVFGLRTPSIWNVIIETASLSDQFIERYSDLIDVVSYIDGIYMIDQENEQLIPVDTKPDNNDQAKTSARRIRIFHNIISSLSSEDYYALRAKIGEYDKASNDVTYLIPACTCPDCAAEIPANKNMSPDNMLFTRHQLAAIGNM